MKLTIFGLTLSSSWGNGHATPYRALLRGLHRLGHRCVFYEKDVEYYFWRRDFTSCDYCDLVLYADWDAVRRRALADAASSDVVMVGSYCAEGARIGEEILGLPGSQHVFYDLDTPVTLENLQAGNVPYLTLEQIPAYDLYLSFTGGAILRDLESKQGARQARPLYGCVDPEVYVRVPPRSEFRCHLSYMGTHSADRQHKLEQFFLTPAQRLRQERFVLAGSLYPHDSSWPVNVVRYDHVAPADHPALYSSSRATLNITREGMARTGYCPSGRFFEAAACGTPIVSDWWEGLSDFFGPEEIVVVHNESDVIAALKREEPELARMAARARQRTLDEHSGECRARQLISYLEKSAAARNRNSLEVAS
ncbi:MAG TPA: glycosyltransferase [Terriglobales bacterium]|nr:glycosyltransferase [Terriglobales bacterium]